MLFGSVGLAPATGERGLDLGRHRVGDGPPLIRGVIGLQSSDNAAPGAAPAPLLGVPGSGSAF